MSGNLKRNIKNQRQEYSTIELSVSARDLKNVDFLSKSDPVCILYIKESNGEWRKLGQTEPILNNLNPDFVKKFNVHYYYGEQQYLKFELYDIEENNKDSIEISDFLGEYECLLSTLISCLRCESPLHNSKSKKKVKGSIIVVAEKLKRSKEEVHITIQAENICSKKKKNVYIKISKSDHNSEGFIAVYRTETKGESNPQWTFCLPLPLLCNCEQERLLEFEVYDDKNGKDKLLGSMQITFAGLKSASPPVVYSLKTPSKKGSEDPENVTLKFVSFVPQIQHTFDDYIAGGIKIKVTIGIDMSKTNGQPSSPSSLHFHSHDGTTNQYARAIMAVGGIIEAYHEGSDFPAFGFGLKSPKCDRVEDLYPLNGNSKSPNCKGISEVLSSYYDCLSSMDMSGPCNFTPVIHHVLAEAKESCDGTPYHILLLLTDGIIDDMADAKEKIIEASHFPMSIIIIGIGSGDFQAMTMLDSDQSLLKFRKREAVRDIVQFVRFRDFDPRSRGTENISNQDCLAREVLREIPDQLTSFMKRENIQPKLNERTSVLV